MQRSGRREGLGLGEKLLIGEQFAGIAAEDQLQRMAVLDAGQSVTGAPELICDRFHNFHARQPLGDFIQRPTELRLDQRLPQELLNGMQSQRRTGTERGLQPIGIALDPGSSGAAPR